MGFLLDLLGLLDFSTILQMLTLIGVFGTLSAVWQAKKSLRAQTVMKLVDGWRDPELYSAMVYVNKLRTAWKKSCSPIENSPQWNELARDWVKEHYQTDDEILRREWNQRRQASQFLSKMGLMTMSGYMKSDDLFGVIPEMGRYLMVLTPIEMAIKEIADSQEKGCADWDHAAGKWEFNYLWRQYLNWYERNRNTIVLEPIDYSRTCS